MPVHLDKLYHQWWYLLGRSLTGYWLWVKYLLLCMGCLHQGIYMVQKLFADWFLHHFLMHAVVCWPLMLLLDGHSSHYTLEFVKLCISWTWRNIVLSTYLYIRTTADSQPIDITCFKPLENYWVDACCKCVPVCKSKLGDY